MKKKQIQLNVDLPAALQASLGGLNDKYARKLEKRVLKIIKNMSSRYADLLDKELHALVAPLVAGAKPGTKLLTKVPELKEPRWTNQ